MRIAANQLQFEIIDEGLAHQPAVLFICGMGMQLIGWPKEFINGISSRGYRAIRYDNRDIGLSAPMDHLGIPNFLLGFLKYKIGMQASPPYSLQDMAIDGLKILETLGVQKAHLIGVSMGGMIAQRMAITAPDKIFSLTSLMSSSSAEHLSGPQPDVLSALIVKPAAPGSEEAKLNALKFMNSLRSPGFPYPPGYLEQLVEDNMNRSSRPQGAMRHMLAVIADTQRAQLLGQIKCPTLILHGKQDPLLPFACAQDTASRITHSKLVAIEGMGHNLPPALVPHLLAPLLEFLDQFPKQ